MPLLNVSVPNRVCWSCTHIHYSRGSEGYSEVTPGWDFELSCSKDYWELNQFEDELQIFRDKITQAEWCTDFELAK